MRWEEFRKRYRQELKSASARQMLGELGELAMKHTITLVYGAKDETHNQAVVIREVLERMTRSGLGEGEEAATGAPEPAGTSPGNPATRATTSRRSRHLRTMGAQA